MNTQAQIFAAQCADRFPAAQLPYIRQVLEAADDGMVASLQILPYKNPTVILIVSLLGGSLGIDRFLLGDTGIGVGKLLTFGGCCIWAIVDLFLIMDRTREVNFELFQKAVAAAR